MVPQASQRDAGRGAQQQGVAEDMFRTRGMEPLASLSRVWADPPPSLAGLLYRPAYADGSPTVEDALEVVAGGRYRAPANLLPVLPVDDRSIAVVVCQPLSETAMEGVGSVLRWHLDETAGEHQLQLVDTDVEAYVGSYEAELDARVKGIVAMRDLAASYHEEFVEPGIRPRTYITRPVRLACQNVIIGLAAFAQDAAFDGLRVPVWQTCEAPHVATHEGNRTLAALMLCDAFQCGGTMEIRFDRHPERRVPASLRRYARTRGIALGEEDRRRITPREARELFRAVTPMPPDLALRVSGASSQYGIAPERLCYMLLAGVWKEIELDFLLACSDRVSSILSGGAQPHDRGARMAESELCRAALLCGLFFRRLDLVDTAAAGDEARAFEDARIGVQWSVIPELGAVQFVMPAPTVIPWQRAGTQQAQQFICWPRAHATRGDAQRAQALAAETGMPVFLIVPADDDPEGRADASVTPLACPDRVTDLDTEIERKLLGSRIGRA